MKGEENMKLSFDKIKDITTGAVSYKEENGMLVLKRFTDEQEELYRITNEDFYTKTFSTAGIKFHFKTDSKKLFLKFKTERSSSRKYFSTDVFVNGRFIGCVDNFSDMELPHNYTKLEFPMGEFSKEFDLGEGENPAKVPVHTLRHHWAVSWPPAFHRHRQRL